MEGHLLIRESERERLKVFERVKRGELQQLEAAEICGLSYRQTRRLYGRYRELGIAGWCIEGGLRIGSMGQRFGRQCWRDIRNVILTLGRRWRPRS